ASGISYLSMAIPAFILGLALSLISLLCLSYVVPRFTLKVEKVAFQSLADVVQKNIQRSHQLKLPGYNIFAEDAKIPERKEGQSDETVILYGPMFCVYDQILDKDKIKLNVPSEFFTARSATVLIHNAEDHIEFTAYLEDGAMFPREFKGAAIGAIGEAQ